MERLVEELQATNQLLRELLENQKPIPKPMWRRALEIPTYFLKTRLTILALCATMGYVGLNWDGLPIPVGKITREVQNYDVDSGTLTLLERGNPKRYFLEGGKWYSEQLRQVDDDYLNLVKESISEGKEFPKEKWLW